MSETNLTNAERIFEEARQRSSPEERCAYLDGACGTDAVLRDRVEALLRADIEAGSFLESPAAGATMELPSSLDRPGMMIGPYKLLQQIGEGGFGLVYMAEQQEPVRRKVALKIIKHGMDTRQVIARFEAERQALAMMDHTNIARVLDAGATPPETGSRPYFVMELVKGVPITEYCDQHQLSMRDRLKLLRQVCLAVQHAHQKGIIHRDLKPSNVLVTLHDGEPVPKIIDFGIAKATHARLTEKTLFTEFRQFIGTPEYMSPEQAEMSGLDIDTRADIFSLGVLLYELLTGTTPFDSQTLRSAGYGEIQRIIREVEPPKPSARLYTMSGAASTPRRNGEVSDQPSASTSSMPTIDEVARRRHIEPRQLHRQLKGELDWIVMKSIEKDRTRRYETAASFAADIDRYLEGLPVEAARPSRLYKVRKLVRRHKVALSVALFIGLLLGFGYGLTAVSLVRTEQAREEALAAQQRLEEMSDYQRQMLAATDPAQAEIMNVTLDEVLARSRELFSDDHAVIGAILSSRTVSMLNAGDLDGAAEAADEALAAFRKAYGPNHPSVGGALRTLGEVRKDQGRHAEAIVVLKQSADILERSLGLGSPATASALSKLFEAMISQEDDPQRIIEEGERMVEAYTLAYGPDHRNTIRHQLTFGLWLSQRRFTAEAVHHLQPSVERGLEIFESQDGLLLFALNQLTVHYIEQDEDVETTRRLFHELIRRFIAFHGESNPITMSGRLEFADWLANVGDYEDSIDMLLRLIDTVGPAMDRTDARRITLYRNVRRQMENNPRASDDQIRRVWQEFIDARRAYLGQDQSSAVVSNMIDAAEAFEQRGMIDDAIAHLREAAAILRETSDDDLRLADVLLSLGSILLDRDQASEAVEVLGEAYELRRANLPQNHRGIAEVASMYGEARLQTGAYARAEELLLQAFSLMMGNPASGPDQPQETIERLVRLYEAWDRPLQAARWRNQLQPGGRSGSD